MRENRVIRMLFALGTILLGALLLTAMAIGLSMQIFFFSPGKLR